MLVCATTKGWLQEEVHACLDRARLRCAGGRVKGGVHVLGREAEAVGDHGHHVHLAALQQLEAQGVLRAAQPGQAGRARAAERRAHGAAAGQSSQSTILSLALPRLAVQQPPLSAALQLGQELNDLDAAQPSPAQPSAAQRSAAQHSTGARTVLQ